MPAHPQTIRPKLLHGYSRAVLDSFVPQFCPDARVLFVRGYPEWGGKLADLTGFEHREQSGLPDLLLYEAKKNWLTLVQIAEVSGPIDSARRAALADVFSDTHSEFTFLSVFADRESFSKAVELISWETDVWIADEPTHLVHFNGVRFLGPYPHA